MCYNGFTGKIYHERNCNLNRGGSEHLALALLTQLEANDYVPVNADESSSYPLYDRKGFHCMAFDMSKWEPYTNHDLEELIQEADEEGGTIWLG